MLALGVAASLQTLRTGAAELEERLWYADNGQQHAWAPGGTLALHRPAPSGASAFARADLDYFRYDNEGDTEVHARYAALAGRMWPRGFRAGAGFEYRDIRTRLKPGWQWDADHPEEKERNADIFGPLLYGAWKGAWGSGRLGWDLEATWLVHDMGDLGDVGFDGSHLSLSVAAVWTFRQLRFSAGYQIERYKDLPPRVAEGVFSSRNRVDGPFVAISVQLGKK